MSGNHYLMLTTVGELYTWGSNDSGQLGMGNRVNQVGYNLCIYINLCVCAHAFVIPVKRGR